MQSKTSRVALLVTAVAIAVAAFLVLRPGDDDEEHAPATAEQAGETQVADEQDRPDDGPGDGTAQQRTGIQPQPNVTEIEIRNGSVVGGAEQIEVETGERIEFVVQSDTPDEIHVHGYEITEQVGPGDPARFSFPADLEGIYEVEAHDIGHVVIAELRVAPS